MFGEERKVGGREREEESEDRKEDENEKRGKGRNLTFLSTPSKNLSQNDFKQHLNRHF